MTLAHKKEYVIYHEIACLTTKLWLASKLREDNLENSQYFLINNRRSNNNNKTTSAILSSTSLFKIIYIMMTFMT